MGPKTTIEFTFGIGQKVRIIANGLIGEVKALWVDDAGVQQFLVRSVSTTACLMNDWLKAIDLNPAEQ